jgi:hypothetical protein
MIRIAIIAGIAYCSIGYTLKNPDQATKLYDSTSRVVSVAYEKVKLLFLDEDSAQVTVMPEQKVTIHL